MHSKHVQVILEGERLMPKWNVCYLPTIGFRVTDETWLRTVQEVVETISHCTTGAAWHCRIGSIASRTSKKECLLFQLIVRTQFFVAFGFQMIADDTLTTDEWKKLRAYGKEKADYLAKQSVADFQSRMENNEQPLQN